MTPSTGPARYVIRRQPDGTYNLYREDLPEHAVMEHLSHADACNWRDWHNRKAEWRHAFFTAGKPA